MPNYEGKSPLTLPCPNCHKDGSHRVINTRPPYYDLIEEFKNFASPKFLPKALGRVREKECESCQAKFETIELSLAEFQNLVLKLCKIHKDCVQFRAQQKSISKIINTLGMLFADRQVAETLIAAAQSKRPNRGVQQTRGQRAARR